MNLKTSFMEAYKLLEDFISEDKNIEIVEEISSIIAEIFRNKGKVIICGNGGSACDAMHFAEEFTGKFRDDRPALPVISLTDSSHITCVGNDYGFDEIFARGVEAYGQSKDLFIGISTSGNSKNVIRAVEKAKEIGMTTVALLGKSGGELKNKCKHELIIKGKTSDRIQEIHMLILHIIIEGVEKIMFPHNYN